MKVAILGAGAVGTQVIENLYLNNTSDNLEVISLTSDASDTQKTDSIVANLMDARQASIRHGPAPEISFKDYRDNDQLISAYRSADIVVITAGRKPPKKEKEKYKEIDSTGRLGQSVANWEIIEDHCKLIGEEGREKLPYILMVSNNADHMADLARDVIGNPDQVIGIGCLTDSLRFRSILQEEFNLYHEKEIELLNQLHLVGYHGPEAILLHNEALEKLMRLRPEITPNALENCRKEASQMGGKISSMQKPQAKKMGDHYGSNQTPAQISRVIRALDGQGDITEALNYPSSPKMVREFRSNLSANINQPTSLSLPVKVSGNGIERQPVSMSPDTLIELANDVSDHQSLLGKLGRVVSTDQTNPENRFDL